MRAAQWYSRLGIWDDLLLYLTDELMCKAIALPCHLYHLTRYHSLRVALEARHK
jgi:hypothetical protein